MKGKMSITRNKNNKLRNCIYNHIINNKREYFLIIILFFIGLIISVMFVNNSTDMQYKNVEEFMNKLVQDVNKYESIDLFGMLKSALKTNLIILLILCFGASTIIGLPIIYGCVLLKGFSIGYTISCIIKVFGIYKGLILCFSLVTLHNIIFLPTIFFISVSGIRLYKTIMNNKNNRIIKSEILRHTFLCIFMLLFIIISAFIEVYLSTNFFIILLKYIKI